MREMVSSRVKAIFIFALFIMGACVEPYSPPASIGDINFLVVDGFINASTQSVAVTLNHAIPLTEGKPSPPEAGANVTVQNETGESIVLAEVKEGVYEADNLNIDDSKNYRLRIVTADGKSYTSGYVPIKQAAVIDSISWKAKVDGADNQQGVTFYVTGHDPNNSTFYYRYKFSETWEYRVALNSDFKKDGYIPVYRSPDEQVYTCWRTVNSTSILTASTKKLTQDVVSLLPINFIPSGSRQVGRAYRMNLTQMSISQEEYEYWQLIKKTTESLGGLFDPLPSQVTGNIHNDADASEQVLGFFSGGYVAEKETYLVYTELPGQLQHVTPFEFVCDVKIIPIGQLWLVGDNIFINSIGIPPTAYSSAPAMCADCTYLGGSNVKPAGWPL